MQTRLSRAEKGELLHWDTEWWNVRIGRGYSADLDRWAEQNMIGCMWLLITSNAQQDIHRAEANGARMMDIRVELARMTSPMPAVSRPATDKDMDALAAISRTAFRGLTRFYADPMLPDDRCDDLYENWLRTSPGWAAEILTIVDVDFNQPLGFITIHVDGDEASIGLVAVAERGRGKGIGINLTAAAVNWAWEQNIPQIKVVTQGCNIPAQRVFQHAGFVTTKTDVWLHSWL